MIDKKDTEKLIQKEVEYNFFIKLSKITEWSF